MMNDFDEEDGKSIDEVLVRRQIDRIDDGGLLKIDSTKSGDTETE
jgi:hypothetical protein